MGRTEKPLVGWNFYSGEMFKIIKTKEAAFRFTEEQSKALRSKATFLPGHLADIVGADECKAFQILCLVSY